MISLSGVCKSYSTRHGRHTVLRGVDLVIGRGEKVGILGRNGAGKSTLVRLISGAELPDSGKISRDMSVSWPLAFGGSFQGSLTGMDNVRFICRVYDADVRKVLPFVEDFAELGEFLYEPVKSYSAGMRARLAFSMSMAIDFDCFLIDEVISVGDTRFHAKCQQELFGKRRDRSMVIVSHEVHNIRAHCDRACVLRDGVLFGFDDVDEAYAFYNEGTSLVKAPASMPVLQSAQRLEGLPDLKVEALTVAESLVDEGAYVPPDTPWLIRQARTPAEALRIMASIGSPGALQALAYARRNPGLEFIRPAFNPVARTREQCCAIFVLSETWLPYVLAVASEVYRRDGLRSVLVYDQWCPALANPAVLGPAVLFPMALSELELMRGDALFPAILVLSHSFGWAPKTAVLLERFPEARVGVYLDGFRNGASVGMVGDRRVEVGFSFGPASSKPGIPPLEVIDPSVVLVWAERVSSVYRQEVVAGVPPPHALVHLRGWGAEPYPFAVGAVVSCMADTIEHAAHNLPTVVLRTDPQASRNFLTELQEALDARGIQHVSFADFLQGMGVNPAFAALPVEQLLARGLVAAADVHVLFDSAAGIALACSPHEHGRIRLALGVMGPKSIGATDEDAALVDAFRSVRDLAARSLSVIQGLRPDSEVVERLPGSYVVVEMDWSAARGHDAEGNFGGSVHGSRT